MGIKIRRITKSNRLNEDDNTQQNQGQQAPVPGAEKQQQQAQPANAAPQAETPQQTQPQNNAPQQPAPAQNQEQQQPQLPEQVTNFFNGVRDNIQKNNIYWALATNLPEELQKAVPEFKQGNQAAAEGITAWDEFKKNPGEQTFNTFLDKVKEFATPKQEAQPQQTQQTPETKPAEPVQNNNQQPAEATAAQDAKLLQDSKMAEFGDKLHERLVESLKMDYYAQQIAKGVRDVY